MTPALELKGLSVRLGERMVLEGMSFSVAAGDVIGVIGPPEAGKSVLFKAIAGLVPHDRGELWALGARVEATSDLGEHRRGIGMAFQNDALFDALSVWDNVAFPLRRRRVAAEEVRARVARRLDDVGLGAATHKLPSELSGGMRKRVGIARAAVIDPPIGLFDDPVAGLDPLTGDRILGLILSLTKSLGMATLIIANDLPVLLPICTRVLMLHQGRVVYEGAPEGLERSARPEVVQFATGADAGPL